MFSLILSLTSIYVIGYIGYKVLDYIKVPAPGLIGTMVIVGILSSKGVPWAEIPFFVRFALQVIIGIAVGMRFSKEKIREIKTFIIPGIIIVVWTIGAGLAAGFLLEHYTGMDLGTSLFSAVPGGITEMAIVAFSYGLDVPVIALFQFMRILGVCLVVPLFVSLYSKHTDGQVVPEDIEPEEKPGDSAGRQPKYNSILATVLIGGAAGLAATYFKVPAGAMLGSMLAIGILSSMGLYLKPLPEKYLLYAQIGFGGIIGLSFTPEAAGVFLKILVPAVAFSVVIILNSIVLGFIIHKVFGWDMITSMLACAPAGLSQMSVIALDMHADTVKVGIIHAMRLAIIILTVPNIISLML